MKKTFLAWLFLCVHLGATALPDMPITDAKNTILNRNGSPRAKEFKKHRLMDQPAFDRYGFGNYHIQYQLDSGRKLMIWMYVVMAPPTVDEVVLFVSKASAKDLRYARGLQLLQLAYEDSLTASSVIDDFKKAGERFIKAQKAIADLDKVRRITPDNSGYEKRKKLYDAYQEYEKATRYYVSPAYDGSMYYLGERFGYQLKLTGGGLQISIHKRDVFKHLIEETKRRMTKMPAIPKPTPEPTPVPIPTPPPKIDW